MAVYGLRVPLSTTLHSVKNHAEEVTDAMTDPIVAIEPIAYV